jgi:hypothetical protein
MSTSRWSSALAAAPLAALLLTGAVSAQESGTPTADERSLSPRAVLPEECQGAAADPADVAAMLTEQTDFQGLQQLIPLGTPADAETAEQINTTVRTALACLNANDFLRLASLTNPTAAQQLLGGLVAEAGDDLESRLAEAPEARQPEGFIRLLAVTDASILADGRPAALGVLAEPNNRSGGPETYLFVFQQEGDALRIDGLFGFSMPPAPAGTPEAEASS